MNSENPFANASKKVNPEAPETSPESLVRKTPEGEDYSLLPEYHQVIQEIANNANLPIDQLKLAYQMENGNLWTYYLDLDHKNVYTKGEIEAHTVAAIIRSDNDPEDVRDYERDGRRHEFAPQVTLNVETGKPEIFSFYADFDWKLTENSKITIERGDQKISFDPNIEDGFLGENPSLHYEVDVNLPVDQVLYLEDFIKDRYLSGLNKILRGVPYTDRRDVPNPVALEKRERKQKLYKLVEDMIQDLLKHAKQAEEKE